MAYMNQEKKKALEPRIKVVLNKYGLKGTISVRDRCSLVVKLKSGKIDFLSLALDKNFPLNVNEYHIGYCFSGIAKDCLLELKDAMMIGNWDNSNPMSDYSDVGWYISIILDDYDFTYRYTP